MLVSLLLLGGMTALISKGAIAMAAAIPVPVTVRASSIKTTSFRLYPGISQADSRSPVAVNQLDGTLSNLVLTSDGMVTATGVAIKTGLFKDISTGLQSFANKADLLVLAVGGTVKRLVMKNVTLKVDRFIDADTFVVTSFHLVLATGTQQVNTTPSPAVTPSRPQPKLTPTPISIPIPTSTPRSAPTPTPTPRCLCLLLCLC